MKPLFKVSLLAATVLASAGCQQAKAATAQGDQVQAVAEKAVHFRTDEDKAAYAIGTSFANHLKYNLQAPQEMGVNLKEDLVLKGIQDVFAGDVKLTEEEVQGALETLDKQLAQKMQEQAAERAAEAEKIKQAGDAFRAEFEKQSGVVKTKSGLLYQVLTDATGEKPSETDTVEVHYVGTLIDGTKFDSSYDRGQTASFPLNRVIAGWTEGLQLMPVGSKYKFVIPSELAYGEQDSPTIPANSTLIFEVELVSIGE